MLLEINDLVVKYGNIEALHGISFHVNEGEIVTLIGANGAGKTTTLHAITRVPPPEGPKIHGGDIRFRGRSLLGVEAHAVVRDCHIALAPEGRHIFGNLTVEENLKLATFSRKDAAAVQKDYQRVYDLFPRLTERRTQRSESLSGGEQQMLAVGRALMTGCNFILLDEPSMGLAPLLMYDMFRTLRKLNEQGMTILLIEQNARLALKFAHRAYVLDTGEIVMAGRAEAMAENPEVQKAYLG
ncbi:MULTISPECIES: ABC transporter ATP-binding protein [Desulfococcus]|jgi:branched-chain amino acid transport system ATP-binding protein|uniref:ABC transporter related protein n=1 Tax=Desulfococcus multivorans DSM 2059 TaxID=1121405 RepID=S7UY25_DESML|nr:ABC transporter ATP-binding protein [Desulfococcus multivorans]AOY58939.1 LivF2: high-affinity branched-chain amino acid transport system, ATP-binding protein [Desulfococcus multivorans]AQV01208.1 ABC transporter ATP-binding protein [Desulfococcus multivorans]EPR39154.1 ABC transporter related protein [Desulfococcus multivorans DSM 2059]MDX9819878.1 ABC transporter ATP-binding protein [Desulfococcus multivorans]SJZ53670.1 amino acid/amide ABC transporter ATP-binding protein 2, HAAT family [